MARSKPYTKKLLIMDAILLVITSGAWAFGIGLRELYRHK